MYNHVYACTYIEDLSVIVCTMSGLDYINGRLKTDLKYWIM